MPLERHLHMSYVGWPVLKADERSLRMSTSGNKSRQTDPGPSTGAKSSKLEAPWWIHAHVWFFMVVFGLSPLLYVLVMREHVESRDWLDALITIVLIQWLLWVAQRRCSSEDLSYWEGLVVVAAAVTARSSLIPLLLSFPLLLFTVTASFVFALLHDGTSPTRHASLCFGRLIVAIHKRRLYRL